MDIIQNKVYNVLIVNEKQNNLIDIDNTTAIAENINISATVDGSVQLINETISTSNEGQDDANCRTETDNSSNGIPIDSDKPISADSNNNYKPESLMAESLGVINYLNMYTLSGDNKYLESAFALIRVVHNTLGHNEPIIVASKYVRPNIKSKVTAIRNSQNDNIINNPSLRLQHISEEEINGGSEDESSFVDEASTSDNDYSLSDDDNDNTLSIESCDSRSSYSRSSDEDASDESTTELVEVKIMNENPLSNGIRTTCVSQLDCNPNYNNIGRHYKDIQNGQHIHQICKWMFALLQTSKVCEDETYGKAAIRLGKHVYRKFCHDKATENEHEYHVDDANDDNTDHNNKKPFKLLALHWKMNNYLTVPIVKCEGLLDTFICLAVFAVLHDWNVEICEKQKSEVSPHEDLSNEISELNEMVQVRIRHINALSCGLDIGEALWVCSICDSSVSLSSFNNDWQRKLKLLSLNFMGNYIDTALSRPMSLRCGYKELCITVGLRSLQKTMQQLNSSSISNNELTVYLSELIRNILKSWKNYLFIHDCTITSLLYCLAIYPGHYIIN
ncbi:hypothetical protein GJ496_008506 [Pomphorhynchus laevis]|nr:hypothetical protein GJ496_008506 [Pomphorhynchus laevis]